MILTTTPQSEGHTSREYKGVVTGETAEAKDTSMQEMMQRAQALGANAIVGIDIDYETVGANGSMLMVATSGTAVAI